MFEIPRRKLGMTMAVFGFFTTLSFFHGIRFKSHEKLTIGRFVGMPADCVKNHTGPQLCFPFG
jgi:putative methionine-R-sulfoxide reductase with GAF domain